MLLTKAFLREAMPFESWSKKQWQALLGYFNLLHRSFCRAISLPCFHITAHAFVTPLVAANCFAIVSLFRLLFINSHGLRLLFSLEFCCLDSVYLAFPHADVVLVGHDVLFSWLRSTEVPRATGGPSEPGA